MENKINKLAYEAYGLYIGSQIDLPELRAIDEKCENQVDIKIDLKKIYKDDAIKKLSKKAINVEKESIDVGIPRVGFLRIKSGEKITIDSKSKESSDLPRVFATGVGMAIALYQRGCLVLHSSAVSINGEIAIFLGAKGAGKSTMATLLSKNGHHIFTDDILRLSFENGSIKMYRGPKAIKLRKDSLEALKKSIKKFEKINGIKSKVLATTRCNKPERIYDTAKVFVLSDGSTVSIDKMKRKKALGCIIKNSFIPNKLHVYNETMDRHIRQCKKVVENFPVYTLSRPMSYSSSSDVAEALKSHFKS
jgi:hypothetical protein